MAFTRKDGINIATRANEYNLHDLLYFFTYERSPREISKSLYHIILTLQEAELPIKDHEGNDEHSAQAISDLANLFGAVVKMESEIKEEFKLYVWPIVWEE